jgi:hypothetical protein
MKIIKLENEFLDIKILPELGGRIHSLINKKSKKDWVWKNNNLKVKKVSKFSDYDTNWQGGWEELFPNDAIEKFSWGKGLDHGELWSAEWNVKKTSSKSLTLSTINLDSGSDFEKSFILNKNKLTVNYSGLVSFDDYFLFKLHLAVPVSKSVNIDCNFTQIRNVDKNFGNIPDLKNNFLKLKKNSNLYGFAYLNLLNNNVKITDENFETLELNYSGDLKYFWLFQTQGGWNGHNVMVLEPASNSKKYLDDAIQENGALQGPKEFKCSYSVIIDEKRLYAT